MTSYNQEKNTIYYKGFNFILHHLGEKKKNAVMIFIEFNQFKTRMTAIKVLVML